MIDFKTRTRTPSVVAILAAGTLLFAATETTLARSGGHSGDRGAMNNHNRNHGMANADSRRTRDRGERLSQKNPGKERTAAKRLEKNNDKGKVAAKSADKVTDQSKAKDKTPVTTTSAATSAPVTGGTTTSAPATGSTTASTPSTGNANPAAVVFNRPLPGIGGNHPLPGTGGTNTIHPIVGGNASATAPVIKPAQAPGIGQASEVTGRRGAGDVTKDIGKVVVADIATVEAAVHAPVVVPIVASYGFLKGGATGAVKEVKHLVKEFVKFWW